MNTFRKLVKPLCFAFLGIFCLVALVTAVAPLFSPPAQAQYGPGSGTPGALGAGSLSEAARYDYQSGSFNNQNVLISPGSSRLVLSNAATSVQTLTNAIIPLGKGRSVNIMASVSNAATGTFSLLCDFSVDGKVFTVDHPVKLVFTPAAAVGNVYLTNVSFGGTYSNYADAKFMRISKLTNATAGFMLSSNITWGYFKP